MRRSPDEDTALDVIEWMDRVGRFVQALSDDKVSIARQIRKAYHLQCLAPRDFKCLMVPTLDETQLEAMLERGEYDRAVESVTGIAERSSMAFTGIAERADDLPVKVLADETRTHEFRILNALETWASGFLGTRPALH